MRPWRHVVALAQSHAPLAIYEYTVVLDGEVSLEGHLRPQKVLEGVFRLKDLRPHVVTALLDLVDLVDEPVKAIHSAYLGWVFGVNTPSKLIPKISPQQ